MKIEFVETLYETAITMYPETAEETAQLYRMVNNTKAEKPYLYLQFNDEKGKKVYGHISMKKISQKSNQIRTSINNRK